MSKIEWTGITWNPTTGCDIVSPGCKNCYAEVMSKRLKGMGQEKYANGFKLTVHPKTLTDPFKWKKPQLVFVNSMSDLFHKDVPFDFIDQVFAVMALTPQHTYQILTKRPERMAEYFTKGAVDRAFNWYLQANILCDQSNLPNDVRVKMSVQLTHGKMLSETLPNVWLGTSVEDQKRADERIPHLLRCPAAVRFLSCEPLLGPINFEIDVDPLQYGGYNKRNLLTNNLRNTVRDSTNFSKQRDAIHWVIAGGESGHGSRPMHPDWVRGIRDQCKAAGVPFFFKQWGEYSPECIGHYHTRKALAIGIDGAVVHYPAVGNAEDILKQRAHMYKNGKKLSGSLLDGVEHKEFPKSYKA